MKGLIILTVSLLLVGCSSLGLAPPQSFDEQLANAYGVYTATGQATSSALTSHTLSEADAEAIQGMRKNARMLLDAAHAAETVDRSGAQSKLTLALTALTALQQFLNTHGSH